MNIKGKHLKLCRYIQANRGIKISEAINQGFEKSMIDSLLRKGIISTNMFKLYLPIETQSKIGLLKNY